MITITSMALILLLTHHLISTMLMCGSTERKRNKEHEKRKKLEKEEEIKREVKRKEDELVVDKWEKEYKLATGIDVNAVELDDLPMLEDEYFGDDGLEPREFKAQCNSCHKEFSAEHDAKCLGFRQWRMMSIKIRQEMELNMKELLKKELDKEMNCGGKSELIVKPQPNEKIPSKKTAAAP
ncbi:hypothetical protein PFISCL1PPCAC_18357 [Pristionchus fissidentatus]|uniref:Uncharacterized protein n=1 Tax=Pristionchus fissidentatus TaxID=1538716 RepID=A0AAV5W9J4_9BILA|nr:hypothetical protein PFISCL1PPCAC_18357 [Pristionchus fissidentatus]